MHAMPRARRPLALGQGQVRKNPDTPAQEFHKFLIVRRSGVNYRRRVEEVWAMARLAAIRAALVLALGGGFVSSALADEPGQIIAVEPQDGAFAVPAVLNDVMTVKFVVDSGSADVSIPENVAASLMKSGTMSGADLLGSKTYLLADGSKVPSKIYRMASVRIGGMVLEDVTVRVAAANSSLLLGQSFLSRLKSWSMDNARRVMIIN